MDSLDIPLSELSNKILDLENLSKSDWVCAFYTEDGNPLTGTLSQANFYNCSELFTLGSKLPVFIVPNFDIKTAEKQAPAEDPPKVEPIEVEVKILALPLKSIWRLQK